MARAAGGGAAASRLVVVGAKTFTEQYVLAEIIAATVQSRTGSATRSLTSLGSTVAFDALRRAEIDLYVDYTGTLWATVMGRRGPGASRREVEDGVRRWLLEEAGVTLVASLVFENAYCFAVLRSTAERLDAFFRQIADDALSAGPMHRELLTEIIHVAQDAGSEPDQARRLHAAFGALLRDGRAGGDVSREDSLATQTEMLLGAFYALTFNWAHLEGYPLRRQAAAAARFLARALAPPEQAQVSRATGWRSPFC